MIIGVGLSIRLHFGNYCVWQDCHIHCLIMPFIQDPYVGLQASLPTYRNSFLSDEML
jgi:hypothetical protein